MRCNINVLGEAIVGDDEARRRLDMVVARLRRTDVDYVSVKISAICPDISALAFDDTVERVAERLQLLYRTAASFDPPKFVNLDMEEYRDLDLTIAVFRKLLDQPEFAALDAGIVLQAYLPDAQAGRARSGRVGRSASPESRRGPTKIRIVKGANLAMENVEAELARLGTRSLPEQGRRRRQLQGGARHPVRAGASTPAVRIGVASHNLFDIAWALVLRREMTAAGRPDRLEIEMLEGMAPSQSEAVRAAAGGVILYAPVVDRDDFPAAIAYLVRRLDENTSPDNFLSHLFDLHADPALFAAEADRFRAAVRDRHRVDGRPRRVQDRTSTPVPVALETPFENAPDTDWTRSANRTWIAESMASTNASYPAGTAAEITTEQIDECVATAVTARPAWRGTDLTVRAEIINRVGDLFEIHRGRVLATMVGDAAKTIAEGDPEVSEAIDFARYYARDAIRLAALAGASSAPLGTIVVTPPWNFPFAIPAGGVLAALAAGNTVILKPAPQVVRTGCVDRRAVLGGRRSARRAAVRAGTGWRRRAPADHPPRRRCGDPDRCVRDRIDVPLLAPRAATACRDERQERDRDHLHGRSRPRRRRPREVGVRACGSEVLGSEPGDHRGAALRRSGVPRTDPRRCCDPAGRSADRPVDRRRPADRSAGPRRWSVRSRALEPGESWLLAPECRSARSAAVVAGDPGRCPTRFVVRSNRVFRAGARARSGPTTSTTRSRSRTAPTSD